MNTLDKTFAWVMDHHPLVVWVLAFVLVFGACFITFLALWTPLIALGLSSWSSGLGGAIGCGIGAGVVNATAMALRA